MNLPELARKTAEKMGQLKNYAYILSALQEAVTSEVERLRTENDSYAVAIQEWAMSQPQVEIANLQITVSDLKAELENTKKLLEMTEKTAHPFYVKTKSGDIVQVKEDDGSKWAELLTELSKAREKVNRYKQYVDAHQKCDSCGSSFVTMLKEQTDGQ